MMPWDGGYTIDVEYLYGYIIGLSPTFLSFCLLNRNIIFDISRNGEGKYLELGFGQGVSLNIHAAATNARFWGTDVNPSHADFALSLANASGADLNIRDMSFEELVECQDLPQFDVITLYGVWSWVSHTSRAAIVQLIKNHLKPGGVVYISYNVIPGWSAAMPIRHLLMLYAQQVKNEAGIHTCIDPALSFVEKLAATNVGYFANNTEAKKFVKHVAELNHHYLMHDFFNTNWHPMPFSEIVTWLKEAKLNFLSSANPLEFLPGLNMSEQTEEFLQTIESSVLRESVRDYLVNQTFRRDIFIRGGHCSAPLEVLEEKRRRRFVLLRSPDKVPMETRKTMLRVALEPQLYQPLLIALAEEEWMPKSVSWLEKNALLSEVGLNEIWQALIVLVGEGQVMPVLNDMPDAVTVSRCRALNTSLLNKARASGNISFLASPVAGMGITVNRSEQLFLLANREGARTQEQFIDFAWKYLQSYPAPGKSYLNESQLGTQTENTIEKLSERASVFINSRLAILKALGID